MDIYKKQFCEDKVLNAYRSLDIKCQLTKQVIMKSTELPKDVLGLIKDSVNAMFRLESNQIVASFFARNRLYGSLRDMTPSRYDFFQRGEYCGVHHDHETSPRFYPLNERGHVLFHVDRERNGKLVLEQRYRRLCRLSQRQRVDYDPKVFILKQIVLAWIPNQDDYDRL